MYMYGYITVSPTIGVYVSHTRCIPNNNVRVYTITCNAVIKKLIT